MPRFFSSQLTRTKSSKESEKFKRKRSVLFVENVTAMIGDTDIAYGNEQHRGRNIHSRRATVAGDGGGGFGFGFFSEVD